MLVYLVFAVGFVLGYLLGWLYGKGGR